MGWSDMTSSLPANLVETTNNLRMKKIFNFQKMHSLESTKLEYLGENCEDIKEIEIHYAEKDLTRIFIINLMKKKYVPTACY